MRDGSIAGYNRYSLHPETKPSDDRLAFQKILREKDKAIQKQRLIMAGNQKEFTARKLRIKNLEAQVNTRRKTRAYLVSRF